MGGGGDRIVSSARRATVPSEGVGGDGPEPLARLRNALVLAAVHTDRAASPRSLRGATAPERTCSEVKHAPLRPRPFSNWTSPRNPLRFFSSLRCSDQPPPLRGRTSARQPTQNTAEMERNAEKPRGASDRSGTRARRPVCPPAPEKFRSPCTDGRRCGRGRPHSGHCADTGASSASAAMLLRGAVWRGHTLRRSLLTKTRVIAAGLAIDHEAGDR